MCVCVCVPPSLLSSQIRYLTRISGARFAPPHTFCLMAPRPQAPPLEVFCDTVQRRHAERAAVLLVFGQRYVKNSPLSACRRPCDDGVHKTTTLCFRNTTNASQRISLAVESTLGLASARTRRPARGRAHSLGVSTPSASSSSSFTVGSPDAVPSALTRSLDYADHEGPFDLSPGRDDEAAAGRRRSDSNLASGHHAASERAVMSIANLVADCGPLVVRTHHRHATAGKFKPYHTLRDIDDVDGAAVELRSLRGTSPNSANWSAASSTSSSSSLSSASFSSSSSSSSSSSASSTNSPPGSSVCLSPDSPESTATSALFRTPPPLPGRQVPPLPPQPSLPPPSLPPSSLPCSASRQQNYEFTFSFSADARPAKPGVYLRVPPHAAPAFAPSPRAAQRDTTISFDLAPNETILVELVVDRKANKRYGYVVSLAINQMLVDSWSVRVYSSSWGSFVSGLEESDHPQLDSMIICADKLIYEKWSIDSRVLEARHAACSVALAQHQHHLLHHQ